MSGGCVETNEPASEISGGPDLPVWMSTHLVHMSPPPAETYDDPNASVSGTVVCSLASTHGPLQDVTPCAAKASHATGHDITQPFLHEIFIENGKPYYMDDTGVKHFGSMFDKPSKDGCCQALFDGWPGPLEIPSLSFANVDKVLVNSEVPTRRIMKKTSAINNPAVESTPKNASAASSRNPFMVFYAAMREQCKTSSLQHAAQLWQNMSKEEKIPFVNTASSNMANLPTPTKVQKRIRKKQVITRPLVHFLKNRPAGCTCRDMQEKWKNMTGADKTAYAQATHTARKAAV